MTLSEQFCENAAEISTETRPRTADFEVIVFEHVHVYAQK